MLFSQKISGPCLEVLESIKNRFAPQKTDLHFYNNLSDILGDFECGFIENVKNTTKQCISIENGPDQIKIFVGLNVMSIESNLHSAVWKVILLHKIFRVEFGEEIRNMASFF